jgi:hypothetical protein
MATADYTEERYRPHSGQHIFPFDNRRMEEEPMKIIAGGSGRHAGLFCVVATALLLTACQQNAGSGSSTTSSYQQASDDQPTWQKRHCCRRAGRNGGK